MPTRKRPAATPYIWRNAAQLHYVRQGAAGRVARELVYVEYQEGTGADGQGGAIVLTLPINADFEAPNEIDYGRGVLYEEQQPEREQRVGERAIALAALVELVSIETLQSWTLREVAKRRAQAKREHTSGRRILARDLLATGIPAPKVLKEPEKSMFRAVERWATGAKESHKAIAGANKARVEALIGGVEAHGRAILEQGRGHIEFGTVNATLIPVRPVLAVYGWWAYRGAEEEEEIERRANWREKVRRGDVTQVRHGTAGHVRTSSDEEYDISGIPPGVPDDAHPAKFHPRNTAENQEIARTVLGTVGAKFTATVDEIQRSEQFNAGLMLVWLNGLGVELNL